MLGAMVVIGMLSLVLCHPVSVHAIGNILTDSNLKKTMIVLWVLPVISGLMVGNEVYAQKKHPAGIQARSYPSIFQAWSEIENRPNEDEISRLARHDLAFAHPYTLLRIAWNISQDQPYQGMATELNADQLNVAHQRKQQLLSKNPNLRLLVEIRYRDAKYLSSENESQAENWWDVGFYPPDSPYWLKDTNGKPVIGWGEDTNADGVIDQNDERLHFLIDFTNEAVQNLIASKALALKNSGLFDGIMLDWWSEDFATSPVGIDDWSETILSREAELNARLAMLQKIRDKVGDELLILVNANTRKIPQSAPDVNGIFMESYKDDYSRGYTLDEIKQMESTLLWAEQNLKEPRINCLEGWRVVENYTADLSTRIAERNSEENQRWMRMITTLSLTHSDGYLLISDDNAIPTPDHLHNWYDFWDAEMGRPIGDKARQYHRVRGLFIREFEKGWAVYNRSGAAQPVTFDQEVTGVNSGKRQSRHQVLDFDGEIFLKKLDAD